MASMHILYRNLLGLLRREFAIELTPTELRRIMGHQMDAVGHPTSYEEFCTMLIEDSTMRSTWALSYLDTFLADTYHRATFDLLPVENCAIPTLRLTIDLRDSYLGWPYRQWFLLAESVPRLQEILPSVVQTMRMPARIFECVTQRLKEIAAMHK